MPACTSPPPASRGVAGHGSAVTQLKPQARASRDSELRCYATWYAAADALALRRLAQSRAILRPVWLACATARLASVRATGRPHPLFLALAAAGAAVGTPLAIEERTLPHALTLS